MLSCGLFGSVKVEKVTRLLLTIFGHKPLGNSYSNVLRRTAEIVANSPQFRRKSSTFVDAIHDLPEKADLAPAQLYSTESGRLFHSGRIVIIPVGLPARGKTCVVLDNLFLCARNREGCADS